MSGILNVDEFSAAIRSKDIARAHITMNPTMFVQDAQIYRPNCQ